MTDTRAQRGKRPIVLQPHAWNRMLVEMRADCLRLRLNDVEIYEHRLGPSDSRQFGLFHYRSRTQAQVREIVLHGNWPTQLTAAELATPAVRSAPPKSVEEAKGLAALTGEPWIPPAATH